MPDRLITQTETPVLGPLSPMSVEHDAGAMAARAMSFGQNLDTKGRGP